MLSQLVTSMRISKLLASKQLVSKEIVSKQACYLSYNGSVGSASEYQSVDGGFESRRWNLGGGASCLNFIHLQRTRVLMSMAIVLEQI